MDLYELHTDTVQLFPPTEREFVHANTNSPPSALEATDPNTDVQINHDVVDYRATLGSFEGERVPLCDVDPDYGGHGEQDLEGRQPRFLHGFEPRTSFLDVVPVITRPIRSIDLHLGRGRGGPEEEETHSKRPNITFWLILTIFSVLFCGWFFGFFALIFVCQAKDERSKGHYFASQRALFKARVLLLVAFGVAAVAWIAVGYRLYEVTHRDTDQHRFVNATTPPSALNQFNI